MEKFFSVVVKYAQIDWMIVVVVIHVHCIAKVLRIHNRLDL